MHMATKTVTNPGFFKSLYASVYSPEFYTSMEKRSFWRGFFYLVGVTALFLLLSGVLLAIPYFSHKDAIDQTVDEIVHIYPEDLVITIQDGKASTNQEAPVYIKLNDVISTENWNPNFKEGFAEGVEPGVEDFNLDDFSLVVVDTVTPFSNEQFKNYHTLVWLAQDAVYVMSENDRTEIIPFEDAENMVISKELVDSGMEEVWAGIKAVIPFAMAAIALFALIGIVIFRMIYLLVHALFLLIVFNIMNLPYDYATAYKMGFYSMTLSTFLMTLITFQPWLPIRGIPFMFSIVSLIIVVVNLDQAKKRGLIKEKKA